MNRNKRGGGGGSGLSRTSGQTRGDMGGSATNGKRLGKKKQQEQMSKLDQKGRNFLKTFGEMHPINDIDDASKRKVQIVQDVGDDDDDGDDEDKRERKSSRHRLTNQSLKKHKSMKSSDNDQNDQDAVDDDIDEEEAKDTVAPYQRLLSELRESASHADMFAPTSSSKATAKQRLSKTDDDEADTGDESENDDEEEEKEEEGDEEEEEEATQPDCLNSYAQEVLCKDRLEESEDALNNDPFHVHFENTLEDKLAEKLKRQLTDRAYMSEHERTLKWTSLGSLTYQAPLDERRVALDEPKALENHCIKLRILERLNEALKRVGCGEQASVETTTSSKYHLDDLQLEMLNVMLSYADFYHPSVDVKADTRVKFTYALHALNHVLKTRSRIIAHNDKLKQSKSNADVEYRDQGLTRPKVLIVVPYRKLALKLVNMFIAMLMRPGEEYVSNKKRFVDAFGPLGEEDEKRGAEEDADEDDDENEKQNEANRPDDFNLLFSGNTEDHFKIGMSVSKKSLKLFTEFYSSDIIIASPLGLKSVIAADGQDRDYDFLSSIELLIVDNADVLMMQNWEHMASILEHMHMQPKKSHETDFSRVRYSFLDGHARFYRQTLVFSRIPAPAINALFNKHCHNYAGKCQIDLLASARYQTGTICHIAYPLAQVFHRVECDSPLELPNARFQFFVDKILPRFRDEMMSHTLIFISSYFDFVRIRNYFKKNDVNSMNISEYSDNKSIDRARYLFYHGKVHFLLLTERFHFYKRYKLRGISHLIFYDLPHYAEYYSNFCNYLPDPKRFKNGALENFSSTVLYSKFDAQRLCAVVGRNRATHMLNSDKSVHMFMIDAS